jgi:hypothetical protein
MPILIQRGGSQPIAWFSSLKLKRPGAGSFIFHLYLLRTFHIASLCRAAYLPDRSTSRAIQCSISFS